MPSRNRRKEYYSGGYYHVYNRGVEKRNIFMDQLDYTTFLKYLKEYLLEKDLKSLYSTLSTPGLSADEKRKVSNSISLKNFKDRLELLVYCLMPNHYHLLIKQNDEFAMKELLQACMTRYTGYFNKRHNRVGPLFQERYKAVAVASDEQLLNLSRYIHRNPLQVTDNRPGLIRPGLLSQPTSYPVYLGDIKQEWVKLSEILSFFSENSTNKPGFSYKEFVENDSEYGEINDNDLTLE